MRITYKQHAIKLLSPHQIKGMAMIPDDKLTPHQRALRELKHNLAAYMAAEIDKIKMEKSQ